jgi:hypothetical protein
MGTKRFLITEDEKREIMSLYNYKGLLQEQKNQLNEGDPTQSAGWSAVGAGTGAGAGALIGGPIGAVIGTVAGAAIGYLLSSGGKSYDRVKKTFEFCRTNKNNFSKPTKDDSRIKEIATDIHDALTPWGYTSLNNLRRALQSCETVVDFCAVSDRYNRIYGETLFDAIDGDIEQENEWLNYVWMPLEKLIKKTPKITDPKKVEDLHKKAIDCGYKSTESYKAAQYKCPSQILINAKKCGFKTRAEYEAQNWACPSASPQEKEKIKKETQTIIYRERNTGGGGTGTKYKTCTETYIKGCVSDTIKKVQGCLGIGADGKMGPNTVSAVSAKIGRSYFTDADVEKLCGAKVIDGGQDLEIPDSDQTKIEQPKPTSDQVEFGGEEY